MDRNKSKDQKCWECGNKVKKKELHLFSKAHLQWQKKSGKQQTLTQKKLEANQILGTLCNRNKNDIKYIKVGSSWLHILLHLFSCHKVLPKPAYFRIKVASSCPYHLHLIFRIYRSFCTQQKTNFSQTFKSEYIN